MKVVIALLTGLVFPIILFLAGSFAAATFDITQWTGEGRFMVAFIGMTGMLGAPIITFNLLMGL